MTPPANKQPFVGVFILKLLLAFASIAMAISYFTGIKSTHTSHQGVVTTYYSPADRWQTLAPVPFLLVFLYGVQRRAPMAWRLGFALLIIIYFANLWSWWLHRFDSTSAAADLLFTGVGGAVVGVCWACWWYKQRAYFRWQS